MKDIKQAILEKTFQLPPEVDDEYKKTINETLSKDSRDILTIISDLLQEKDSYQQLALKLQYSQDEATTEEIEKLMKSLLPFLDGLEHILKLARAHPPSEEINNWLRTFESLYFRITNILENFGLKAIESVGNKVNLDFHEVVEYIPSKESAHNIIIAERQKGYTFKDKVIRDAKVVVSYSEGSV